jgi:hypothetical protein
LSTKPALQKILKEIIHREDEDKHSQERMVIVKSQEMSRLEIVE